MKSFTNEEYLALCEKLLNEQYDEALDDYNIAEMEWIPTEETKKKRKRANTSGFIDLTEMKSNQIKPELFKCTNLKVGLFKLRISHCNDHEEDDNKAQFSLEVWEERHKTPNGMPCKIDFPMVFAKDSRFKDRPWLKHFQGGNAAYRMPVDTLVEVIRWMQAIQRLTCFL